MSRLNNNACLWATSRTSGNSPDGLWLARPAPKKTNKHFTRRWQFWNAEMRGTDKWSMSDVGAWCCGVGRFPEVGWVALGACRGRRAGITKRRDVLKSADNPGLFGHSVITSVQRQPPNPKSGNYESAAMATTTRAMGGQAGPWRN